MLEWVTFTMALISALLWLATVAIGVSLYRANRAQIQAMRGMARMMKSPPLATGIVHSHGPDETA